MEHMGSRKVCLRSFLAPTGVHTSELRSYVCIRYGPPRAPLLLPWLGEVQGVSLAMTQGKALPVLAHTLMFRVPTVLYGGAAGGRKCAAV